ncbi:MAG: hypothetical protein FP833_10435 [Atribacteria sp.]|nr:hypothetical protein [Candidatus Atribacteria bacterium]
MGIINIKKIIIFLLAIGVMAAVTGCARWPEGPGPGPGETEYQLEITVEVSGIIDSSNGIYYIVMDADGNSATGPGYDILFWDDRFYYIKLEDEFFDFAQKEEGSPELYLADSLISGNKIQVTVALSDLEKPNSIDINVITTDSDNNTYDHLDSYFTISTVLGSTGEGVISGGGTGGADFDIVKATAVITHLY